MAEVRISTFSGKDSYVFIPACCYAGNRFQSRPGGYPPMFTLEEAAVDMPAVITDIPRLNPDGSGKIEVTAGDAAVPCVGVFSPSEKRGILVFTVQEIQGENIGLGYENGEICLTWPARREMLYRWIPHMLKNDQPWEDKPGEIPHKVLDFPCENLARFFRVFFENRKIMGLDDKRPEVRSPEKQFVIQRDKFNRLNWNESLQIYMIGTNFRKFQVWQPGWVGGGISGYPLMKLGGKTEWERGIKTLEFLFDHQGESGFYYAGIDKEGRIFGDGFGNSGTENWHLLRKSADVLYFLFKYFDLMQERNDEIPEKFTAGARKTAEGFRKLWENYGQFGQFADVHTGALCVGGSAGPAIAAAGLAKASAFFGEPCYLKIAEAAAEKYFQDFLSKGYTTGGPGEILQCVDSESAFGLLESFVVLYEMTKKVKWLQYAGQAADYCSSWVVAYNYRFPVKSEFSRHNIKTVGAVFANIQNKHAAPGICTLSGDSLLKLWKWTGDRLYLELIRDIALPIPQYTSTKENPFYDYDLTPEERDSGDEKILAPHRLDCGFINERVNLSDWEEESRVGGVFCGSTWAETSSLLCLAEVTKELNTLDMGEII